MLATQSYADLLPAPALPKLTGSSSSASNLYPPIMDVCAAQADPGFCKSPVCLVGDEIFCGYRLSLSSLGNYCLHPLHEKIVERTAAIKDSEKNAPKLST